MKLKNPKQVKNKSVSPLKNLLKFNPNKLSAEDLLSNWNKELESLRIMPIVDEKRDLLIKSFFDSNKSFINKNIKSNKSIKSAVQELNHVFNADDMIFDFTLRTTGFFVRNIVKLVLTLEINYLMFVKENLMDNKMLPSYKEIVEGELINYDLKNETFELKDAPIKNLLGSIGTIIYIYAKTLSEKNSEWLENFMKQHKKHLFEKANTQKIHLKNKADPKPSDKKESEKDILISKIKEVKEKLIKLNPPKKISVSAVSRELGYRPKQRQSFVDKMVSLKLVNRNSVKKDFDKI